MDLRIGSKEQEELVLNNYGLVYYLVNKMEVSPSDYDDLVSVGTIGLIKAAATFEESKNIKFATYASRCINNEIYMYFRKNKSHANDISLDEPIASDNDGREITLADKIPSNDRAITEEFEEKALFERVINIILNQLSQKERIVMLYNLAGSSQMFISEKTSCSQSYVSRLINKISCKVKSFFAYTKQFKEVFLMTMADDLYKITFSSKDVKNFNKIFSKFLLKLTSTENLCDFKVDCNNERIIIQVPAVPESFAFIAQIIQEIDEFTILLKSNENSLLSANDMLNVKVSNKTDEQQETSKTTVEKDTKKLTMDSNISKDFKNVKSIESSQKAEIQLEEDINSSMDANLAVKRKSKVKRVREYMLSKETFTSKELKEKFPGLSSGTIGNAIYLAKENGLIVSIGRGKYKVNKN